LFIVISVVARFLIFRVYHLFTLTIKFEVRILPSSPAGFNYTIKVILGAMLPEKYLTLSFLVIYCKMLFLGSKSTPLFNKNIFNYPSQVLNKDLHVGV